MNQLVDLLKMFVDQSLTQIQVKFTDMKQLCDQVLNFQLYLQEETEMNQINKTGKLVSNKGSNKQRLNHDLMSMVEVQMKHKNVFVCFLHSF